MTSSTMSRLSAPRSSMKLASSVTFSASTPRCSTTIFFTRSAVSLMWTSSVRFCAALASALGRSKHHCVPGTAERAIHGRPMDCFITSFLAMTAQMKGARPLTAGEIELARSVFGDAIDYARVKLVRRKWWPFQPRDIVMAPTGNIHFHPRSPLWSEDFSSERLSLQGLFIHELTHVWQSQTRGRFYLVMMRHPFCRYSYELVEGRPFGRYGL